jgi:hypothetical protein
MAKLIGNKPNQVPTNGDLGKLAFQEPEAVNITGGTIDGATIGGSSAAAITGTTITGTSFVSSGDMTFGDNDKAIFGAGSDLEIFSNGSSSSIVDNSGNLNLKSVNSDVIVRTQYTGTEKIHLAATGSNGETILYHSNSPKITTKSTGIDVTGNVVSDGASLDGAVVINESGADVDFRVESDTNTHAFFLDGATGNVALGTSSPGSKLDVVGGKLRVSSTGTAGGGTGGEINAYNSNGSSIRLYDSIYLCSIATDPTPSGSELLFTTNGTSERMRIDRLGNLLVGKTSADFGATAGFELNASIDKFYITRSGASTAAFNRLSTDGEIVGFAKDGTTVGSIGSRSGDMYLGTGDTNVRFNDALDNWVPANSDGSDRDNAINLGQANARFKDLYLSGGVYLGGTGTANKLDDYEEGTWTVTWNSLSGTPSNTTAYYRKIGGIVYWVYNTGASSISATANSTNITGFPFSGQYASTGVGISSGTGSVNTGMFYSGGSPAFWMTSFSSGGNSMTYSGFYFTAA